MQRIRAPPRKIPETPPVGDGDFQTKIGGSASRLRRRGRAAASSVSQGGFSDRWCCEKSIEPTDCRWGLALLGMSALTPTTASQGACSAEGLIPETKQRPGERPGERPWERPGERPGPELQQLRLPSSARSSQGAFCASGGPSAGRYTRFPVPGPSRRSGNWTGAGTCERAAAAAPVGAVLPVMCSTLGDYNILQHNVVYYSIVYHK